jgi:hypothetical protein
MFEQRTLPADLDDVRAAHAPESVVLDVTTDFETLPPATAEDLGLIVEALDPTTYPTEWLPDDAPRLLYRYAGSDFTIGMPGDGTVTWTRQTRPPIVFAKARAKGTPDDFLDFLLAEAFVQLGADVPEHFLPFFGERYRALDAAIPLDSGSVYQIAAALFDGWVGLRTRAVFEEWDGEYPRLFAAWEDAGQRLTGRLAGLPAEVARGRTDFADATELACAAIKHGVDLPAPFSALDTRAYGEHGPDYAVRWAEKTFEQLAGD